MNKVLAIFSGLLMAALWIPNTALAQGAECTGQLCGTPDQSGGGCGCGCGSILVAMTDRGDAYQFADDFDGDGIEDEYDNCPFVSNYEQIDGDSDAFGDACDVCPSTPDALQSDIDMDRIGDACDPDVDNDGILAGDNCPRIPNIDQLDTNTDGEGDACDDDDDGDQILDVDDLCRLLEGNVPGAGCDNDLDFDGVDGSFDNCPTIYNPSVGELGQPDMDGNGIGDACDLDLDGDAIPNFQDNCVGVPNPSQIDLDRDGLGDAGSWNGGAESCDSRECYVIEGDAANCLDPNVAFNIYLSLKDLDRDTLFNVDEKILVVLFSNRLGQPHSWTAQFTKLPDDSDAFLENAVGEAATLAQTPQVANCVRMESGECVETNGIAFTPDQPGRYEIKVTASLAQGDPEGGPSAATYTIVADVQGEAKGGCAAAGTSGGLAALALGLLLAIRRRR